MTVGGLPSPLRIRSPTSAARGRRVRWAANGLRAVYDGAGMTLPGIELHPHANAVLGAALAPGGRPSHAYLFQGPAGTGKAAIARAFAAALLSDGAVDPDNARERALRGAHPDLTWVVPSGAHELLTSDVDEPVVAAATRTPFESSRRVFVIEAVDTMNDEAANRMLKTLEEPPAFVHIVLLTNRPGEVLPTIASRCQRVRFDPLATERIADRLADEGADPASAEACAALALGDGGRARTLAFGTGPDLRDAAEAFARAAFAPRGTERPGRELLELSKAAGDAAFADVEDALADTLELVSRKERTRTRNDFTERSRRARRRAFRRTLELGLDLVSLWYRDVGCVAGNVPEVVMHRDRMSELREDAAALGDPDATMRAAIALVEDTRQRLVLNVSEELALDGLAERLRRACLDPD